jgi:polyisoprenyl-phosphate glycosyltransferase
MAEEPAKPRLWVVCPSYDDVDAFAILRGRILEVVAGAALPLGAIRFVLVDDTGGVDPKAGGLRELEDVTVLDPPFNLGHQRAIVFGVRSIGPWLSEDDVVVTLDSDGEDQPEDLPRLLGPLLAEGDLRRIVLARWTKRSEPLLFRLLYLLFRIVFRVLTGTVVRTGNFAAYRGWTALYVLRHPYFDLCYSSTFLSLNLEIEYVPCERGSRYAGRSRMSYERLITHGLSMLVPFTDRIAVRALVALSVLSGLCIALAVAVGCVDLAGGSAPGWVLPALLSLVAVSLIALGNLGVLFAIFSQARGMSLTDVEEAALGSARAASGSPARAR